MLLKGTKSAWRKLNVVPVGLALILVERDKKHKKVRNH